MRLIITGLVVFLLGLGGWYVYKNYVSGAIPSIIPPSENISELIAGDPVDFPLNLPEGATLTVYREGLEAPRDMILDPNGHVIVSIPTQKRVVLLTKHQTVIGLVTELKNPHGLALNCQGAACTLFIAEEDKVISYKYNSAKFTLTDKKVLYELPTGGRHTTRSLLVQDNKLYISIGSACDVCVESDRRRGAVYVSELDGSDFRPFSTGLRNSVFMAIRPGTNEIWATEMGRDFLGDDLPPDEINILKDGAFYGWPYCYGDNVHDTVFQDTVAAHARCEDAIPMHISIESHSAPLGLAFLNPHTLLVAYHGSWNRTKPTGYKIMKFELDNEGKLKFRQDYITGWINENNEVLGRPADILVKDEKTVFISDDKAGLVYLLQLP